MGSLSQPAFGKRLIPQILDDLAASDPERPIYSLAKSADISEGLVEITARHFSQAVDKLAWWIVQQIGASKSNETVGYIGPHDLRHVLLTYASVKAEYQALFLSPKNSTEGALSVLGAADCNIWVQAHEQPCTLEFLQKRPMKTLNMPGLDELLDVSAGVEPFPYTKTWEEAKNDCLCLLHTSGSTGLPKPIKWTHALVGTMDAVRLLPPVEGDDGLLPWTHGWNEKDRIYSSFPMSHGAGIIMDIMIPSLFAMHCVLGPPGVLPNMSLIQSLAEHAKIDVWSMVPSLVDELGESPDVLAKFQGSKFICASGGPVTPVSAAKVNDVIRVLNLTGTSEGLFTGNLWVDREDWLYFAFHPWSGFEFKEVEPGVFEHWTHRDDEHWELFQGIFTTFPDKRSVNFKDLYTKHPTKPNLYAYKGRNDDVVVLGNGYKISPQDSEALITTHPAVSGCLIVGTGKLQAAVLVELKDPASSAQDPELLDSIWTYVQKANKASMHKDQLHREYIMFADPERPFVRTDKRTIKRHDTLKLYATSIDEFYLSRETELDAGASIDVDATSIDSITSAIRHVLSSVAPNLQDAPADADLFNMGLDSLLTFRVVRSLRGAMGLQDHLASRHLYANPTIARFAATVAKVAALGSSGVDGQQDDEQVAQMRHLFNKYRLRQSSTLNPYDVMMPRIWVKMMVYIPLQEGASFKDAFKIIQQGLTRVLQLVPTIDGRVRDLSDKDPSCRPGQLYIDKPPAAQPASDDADNTEAGPRQLVFKDLSNILPSFDYLRSKDFTTLFKDEVVLDAPWFPERPCDLFYSRANFVRGGCLLATGFHHTCWDGTGIVTTLRAWAESCRYVQGDLASSCSWLDPQSMNRNLFHTIWQQEGLVKPASEVNPEVWGHTGYKAPPTLQHAGPTDRWVSPTEPPAKQERHLECRTFYLPPESVQKLEEEASADPNAKGRVNTSDIIQAIYWKAMIRARYRAQTECHGRSFDADQESILELPIDARPFFSDSLPDSYMANLMVINRLSLPVKELCSPETSIGRIALAVREAAPKVTKELVHDSYALLQAVDDYSQLKYAFMRLDGLDVMITNMMLLPASVLSFGDETGQVFGNDGVPEAVRPLMDGFNSAWRMAMILPMRQNGGIDLLLGLYPEELDKLMEDEEFLKYAVRLG